MCSRPSCVVDIPSVTHAQNPHKFNQDKIPALRRKLRRCWRFIAARIVRTGFLCSFFLLFLPPSSLSLLSSPSFPSLPSPPVMCTSRHMFMCVHWCTGTCVSMSMEAKGQSQLILVRHQFYFLRQMSLTGPRDHWLS